ncbi:porin [Halarcobacter anaerophilus]|uniref:Porin domain-containing protein n=1 Tax=Halarcobacter anaerophilus TaxID=877500 RepID=A0A4Q0XWB3_9BACT|nr:porin [Halarcobacter anaerophilus]QDF27916.1 Campylo_MOMP domain-containing protein [Halarcobacter anaerophilus]RXJ61752.1 hypothetical protein CRV06_12220 [Halarcobacter anaerophilus]
MTKFTKMSLIAALALAGTTASAQPLAEAIKNVDVSGTVAYRYNDYEDQAKGKKSDERSDSATNNYKIAVNLKSKVNDDITANMRFIIGADDDSNGEAILGTSNDSDDNLNANLSEVNFTYTGVKNLSLTVGKQAVDTPWTVARDSMGDEQTGTGAVAAYTAGPVTLVGAYFNQTNFNSAETGNKYTYDEDRKLDTGIDGSEDIYVLGLMASFMGINLDAFYSDLDDKFDSYTVGLNGSWDLGAVTLAPFARYTSLSPDGTVEKYLGTDDDQELWQLGLSANMGIFSAFAAYGEAGSDGGLVYIDSGSATNMDYHWRVTADGTPDTEYIYAHVAADVTDKINVGLYYSEADYDSSDDGDDVSEVYAKVSYAMSKNFTTYVQFGDLDVDDSDEDGTMGRVHVQYSF